MDRHNIGQIMQGELQFGVAQSDWQYHAYNGTKPDRVKPFDGLRAVFSAHRAISNYSEKRFKN